MRTLCTITMPAATANRALKDGLLPKLFEQTVAAVKPEAVYFTALHGERSAMFVFDMKSSSEMPSIAEPYYVQLDARVEFKPVMNPEELKAGLAGVQKR